MFFDKIAKIVSLSFDVSVFTSPVSTLLNNELIIISRSSLPQGCRPCGQYSYKRRD